MKDMQDRIELAETQVKRARELLHKLIAENDVLVERLATQDERIADLERQLADARGGAGA